MKLWADYIVINQQKKHETINPILFQYLSKLHCKKNHRLVPSAAAMPDPLPSCKQVWLGFLMVGIVIILRPSMVYVAGTLGYPVLHE